MTTNTILRRYQKRAVDLAYSKSCIVVLPTGTGKTLIAASTINRLFHSPEVTTPQKFLFLVPTCLLVSQQANAIRTETSLNTVEYMGGKAAPSNYDALVSTPGAFLALSTMNQDFALSKYRLIVFDEVHHVVKRHPYRKIARLIQGEFANKKNPPHILGLTASLTYAMSSEKILNNVRDLCNELGISGSDCIFSASTEELLADGYSGASHNSSTSTLNLSKIDNNINLEIPGKPHTSLDDFLKCVKQRRSPIHPLSLELMDVVRKTEIEIKTIDKEFSSPIGAHGKYGRVSEWGKYATSQSLCFKKNIELERLYSSLSHLYEAVRLIVNSRQVSLELSMSYLEFYGVFAESSMPKSTTKYLLKLFQIWKEYKPEFTRLSHLKEVILQQNVNFGTAFKCVIFVQQRLTSHIVDCYIKKDPDLKHMPSDVIYAATTPATALLSVSNSQSAERIKNFAAGKLQILCSTSVAEEGMDVPAANCVICFDNIQTPVALVQRRGRARQANSSFLVLDEREDRPVTDLLVAEKDQHDVISKISEAGIPDNTVRLIEAQKSRIRNARAILMKESDSPLAIVKLYAQKVAGEILEATKMEKG
ncbi:Interferon-induced helicase C domain-containing protein 1, partial [Nowakowskiella sp. JEL0078]